MTSTSKIALITINPSVREEIHVAIDKTNLEPWALLRSGNEIRLAIGTEGVEQMRHMFAEIAPELEGPGKENVVGYMGVIDNVLALTNSMTSKFVN